MSEIATLREFRGRYDEYVQTVSSPAIALSWQALESIWGVLVQGAPDSVLEYGSGISTALLATYASQVGFKIRSYDSDEGWCAKSNQFLEQQGLGTWATCEYALAAFPAETAQFVLWDYDKNPMRVELMPVAFENLERGGVMYVDDMHSAEIRGAFERLPGTKESDTPVDGFGRYGSFIRKD